MFASCGAAVDDTRENFIQSQFDGIECVPISIYNDRKNTEMYAEKNKTSEMSS